MLFSLGKACAGILVVLTNIAGVWKTSTQEAARIGREQSADEARREREARARDKKKWEGLWKDVDENFKKTDEFWKQFERDFKVPKIPKIP